VRNLALFSTSLNFEPLAFENSARNPNAETNFLCSHDGPMSSPSLVKLGPRTPENPLSVMPHPLKLHGESDKSLITQPWIIRFRSDFVEFKRITPEVLWKFEVNMSKVKATAWHNVFKNLQKLENVAITNALQLEAARAAPSLPPPALITTSCQVWSRWTYQLPYYSVFAADTLLYSVTLTFDPVTLTFDLWPWTFAEYQYFSRG